MANKPKVHKIIGSGTDRRVKFSCGKEFWPGDLPMASTEWEHVSCTGCLRTRSRMMNKIRVQTESV